MRLEDTRTGRRAHACAVARVAGRQVLVVTGGQNDGGFLDLVEYLELEEGRGGGRWSALPPLGAARRNHVMVAVSGLPVVVGGDSPQFKPGVGFSYRFLDTVERYNEGEGRWVTDNRGLALTRSVMTAAVVPKHLTNISDSQCGQ